MKSVNGQGDFFFCDGFCDAVLCLELVWATNLNIPPCQIRHSSCLFELAGVQMCGIVEIRAEIRLEFEIY